MGLHASGPGLVEGPFDVVPLRALGGRYHRRGPRFSRSSCSSRKLREEQGGVVHHHHARAAAASGSCRWRRTYFVRTRRTRSDRTDYIFTFVHMDRLVTDSLFGHYGTNVRIQRIW